jgi:hypothetical protein
MDVKLLIDAIVRQTTVLIAQLSTSAGIRAPLAHIADQVFLDLAAEIEAQGVGRKVAADMFGLALRSYQKKVQRLTESAAVRDRTRWEAVLEFMSEQGSVTRERLRERFQDESEEAVGAVLNDLVGQGILYATGRGPSSVYGLTTDSDRRRMAHADRIEAVQALVWLSLYREPMSRAELAAHLSLELAELEGALSALIADGRAREERGKLRADSVQIPVGAPRGWEVAVLDHFSAVARAIAAKVRGSGPRSGAKDVVGGATLTFEVWPSHPHREEVRSLLERLRGELNDLWTRVHDYNDARAIPEHDCERVTFYLGQNVEEADGDSEEPA